MQSKHTGRNLRTIPRWLVLAVLIIILMIIRNTTAENQSAEGQPTPPLVHKEATTQSMPTTLDVLKTDKGLATAWQHQFFQTVNKTDEHHGLKLVVKDIIADEIRMGILYSVESIEDGKTFTIEDVQLTDGHGESLKASYSFADPYLVQPTRVNELIDVAFDRVETIPDAVTVKLRVNITQKDDRTALSPDLSAQLYTVTFPVDKKQFIGKKKEYALQQNIKIDNQQLTITKLTIYPTKAVVDIAYDPANTAEIFGIDRLRIVNERGESWGGSGRRYRLYDR